MMTKFDATQLRAPEMKAGVLNELLMFLEIHSTLEEELFYPELQKFDDAAALIEKSFEDPTAMENWIQCIRSAPKTAAAGIALIEMREAVELHCATEEKELFPSLSDSWAPNLSNWPHECRNARFNS
ncbi:MAG: hemerythrin domain-containing protein [Methylotenera sp.]|nr:hemerythrin domain-containing protein [Oligoflexia bacterium]